MKKKLLSLFAAVAVMLSLSACQSGDTGKSIELFDEVVSDIGQVVEKQTTNSSEANSTQVNYITDWSIYELVQNIELNGKTYSMPFTLEDLGVEYSIEENTNANKGYRLYYNDQFIAIVDFDEEQYNININQRNIISFSLASDIAFKIGDIEHGETKESILNNYGEPSVIAENGIMFSYVFQNNNIPIGGITLFFDNKNEPDKLNSISIIYNEVD
ncbi:MAG: hypothetical protein ACI4KG_08595 [Oscillospiraceae bacterium]